MKKLLKIYGFGDNEQYYDMTIESKINGQVTQAKNQFSKLPKENKKELVKNIAMYFDDDDKSLYNFFFDLL